MKRVENKFKLNKQNKLASQAASDASSTDASSEAASKDAAYLEKS